MNCVLFGKIDKVFLFKKKTLKILENCKKKMEKSRNSVSSDKFYVKRQVVEGSAS